MVRKYFILFSLLCISLSLEAQDCFARISLDRKTVYVQQPFKVTITVLTATWYTAPLDFDNIQLPNAFILPFDQTQPGMFDIGYDKYAGLTFYFIVFPYKEGTFTIPPISIVATTPPKAGSESRKITIKTKAQQFTVRTLSKNLKSENVIVAKNIFVRERWNKPLNNLKVGDMIERTITIDARGTLPQFIPPLSTNTLSFASIYPHEQQLTDLHDEYDANGRSTQSTTYLLEKEGEFLIPAVTLNGWNPLTRKQYTRQAVAQTIHVQTNSNLGILTSIRDSLSVNQPIKTTQVKAKGPKMMMGIVWYWFLAYAIALLVMLYLLVRWSIRLIRAWEARRASYRQSEAYWFHQLMRSSDAEFWKHLYQWWDHVNVTNKTSALRETAIAFNDLEWKETLQHINEEHYSNASHGIKSLRKLDMGEFRAWLLTRHPSVDKPCVSENQQEYR